MEVKKCVALPLIQLKLQYFSSLTMILTYQKNHFFLAGDFVLSAVELWFSRFAMPWFSASSLFLQKKRDLEVYKYGLYKQWMLSFEESIEALQ